MKSDPPFLFSDGEEGDQHLLMVLAISVPVLVVLVIVLILVLLYRQCFPRLGYTMVARPFQNTVVKMAGQQQIHGVDLPSGRESIHNEGSTGAGSLLQWIRCRQSAPCAKKHCQAGGFEGVRWERKIW